MFVREISDDSYQKKHEIDINERDIWNADTTIMELLVPIISAFRDTNIVPYQFYIDCGVDYTSQQRFLFDVESSLHVLVECAWNDLMNRIIRCFENYNGQMDDSEIVEFDECMQLFSKYFRGLWT